MGAEVAEGWAIVADVAAAAWGAIEVQVVGSGISIKRPKATKAENKIDGSELPVMLDLKQGSPEADLEGVGSIAFAAGDLHHVDVPATPAASLGLN